MLWRLIRRLLQENLMTREQAERLTESQGRTLITLAQLCDLHSPTFTDGAGI